MPLVSSGNRVAPHRSPLPGGAICIISILRIARLAPAVLVTTFVTACVRPPLADSCTHIEPGALVVSELRGPQAGSYRQWIELYNASDEPVAVKGMRFSFTRVDGSSPVAFVVRDEAQEIAPGAYFVVGGGDPAEEDYIDYDYTADYHSSTNTDQPRDLYGAARLELFACATVVDSLVYQMPATGTLALDGGGPPDAALNDDSEHWCFDERTDGPQTEIGLRGSPGEANLPCP